MGAEFLKSVNDNDENSDRKSRSLPYYNIMQNMYQIFLDNLEKDKIPE